MSNTILETIADHARERVAAARARLPQRELEALARERRAGVAPDAFYRALRKPGLSFVCECKKASPSKGVIAEDYEPVEIARSYAEADADAISVLTEPRQSGQEERTTLHSLVDLQISLPQTPFQLPVVHMCFLLSTFSPPSLPIYCPSSASSHPFTWLTAPASLVFLAPALLLPAPASVAKVIFTCNIIPSLLMSSHGPPSPAEV